MMPTEHDEALVERVALAILNWENTYRGYPPVSEKAGLGNLQPRYMTAARAAIYPPAPPKTRLQVARELLAAGFDSVTTKESILNGYSDSGASIEAVLAALALPAMED